MPSDRKPPLNAYDIHDSRKPKSAFIEFVELEAAYKISQPKTAADFLEAGAATNRERSALYGESASRVGRVLEALYPTGVRLLTQQDHNRFRFIVQIVDKLCRYTGQWPRPHADSLLDLSVYAAMLNEEDHREVN